MQAIYTRRRLLGILIQWVAEHFVVKSRVRILGVSYAN